MALGYRGMAQDGPLFPRTPGLYRAWVWHAKWRAAVVRATSAEDKQHDKRQGESQRGAADEETREAKAAGIEALELRSQE